MRIIGVLKMWVAVATWSLLTERQRSNRRCLCRRFLGLMLVLLSLPHLAQAWEAPVLLEGTIKVSAEDLLDLKAEFDDLVIINIGYGEENLSMNIEGAVTVSDKILSPTTLAKLTKDKFTPLVIFAADEHSIHGYKAARQAVSLGYNYVFWFRGGLKEWLDKGMPVVQVQE